MRSDAHFAWTILAVSVALVAGFALKAPCADGSWTDYEQYELYCYSDILPLFFIHDLNEDAVPYVDSEDRAFEYPVGTGFVAYLTAVLTTGVTAFFLLNVLLLAVAGYAATIAIWRSGANWPHVLWWAASPALVAHAFTNWDLLAVACAAAGWADWTRRRDFRSAVWFGVGGAVKLYPAFFLLFLFLAPLARRDGESAGRVAAGGFLGLGTPNLLVMMWDFDGWLATWRFHAERVASETPWALLEGAGFPPEAASLFVAVLLAAVAGALGFIVWTRHINPLAAGGAFTLAFLLLNRVYSPQYTLWLLPILLLLGVPGWRIAAFTLADLAVFLTRYRAFIPPDPDAEPFAFDPQWKAAWDAAVAVRWLTMVLIMVWLGRRLVRWAGTEGPGSGLSYERAASESLSE